MVLRVLVVGFVWTHLQCFCTCERVRAAVKDQADEALSSTALTKGVQRGPEQLPLLHVRHLLYECAPEKFDCFLELKSDAHKCRVEVGWSGDYVTLSKCMPRNRGTVAPPPDGLGDGKCCPAWSEPVISSHPVGHCMTGRGCEVKFANIRVRTNAWNKLALEVTFPPRENSSVAGARSVEEEFVIFRTAKMKLRRVPQSFLDNWKGSSEHASWLLDHFKTHPDALMEAIAFSSSPELAEAHEDWYWAADTTAQTSASLQHSEAAIIRSAQFRSIFTRLPMNYFLGMCSSGRCTLQVLSDDFKCNLQVNPDASEDCYLQLYGCKIRHWSSKTLVTDAFPERCIKTEAQQGCCTSFSSIGYDAHAQSATGLSLTIPSISAMSVVGGFDRAFLLSRSDDWACGPEVPAQKCSLAKSLARLLRKESSRTKSKPGRPEPGASVMLAILGARFPELRDEGSMDMDLCIDQGLAQANRMRMALLVKAFSGIISAVIGLFLGPFAPLVILLKLLMRVMAGGHYAEVSCIFEVTGSFPGYRDQLLSTDYSMFGAKKFWSYGAAKEMEKCMDTKNKLFRMLKSGKKPAAAVAAASGMGGAAAGITYLTVGGGAIITKAAVDTAQIGKGASSLLPTVEIAGSAVPLFGLFLSVGEMIAGLHQMSTLYNWARFRTYRECTLALRADLHQDTRSFLETFEAARESFQDKQAQLLPRYTRIRMLLTCLLGHFRSRGQEDKVDSIRVMHEKVVNSIMHTAESMQDFDQNLKKIHEFVVRHQEENKFRARQVNKQWGQKEKREFNAELLLNPMYYLLESLFPNKKYGGTVQTQEAYDDAKEEVEELAKEIPAVVHAVELSVEEPTVHTPNNGTLFGAIDASISDFCPKELLEPGNLDSLMEGVREELRGVHALQEEASDQVSALTPLVAEFVSGMSAKTDKELELTENS